MLKKDLRAKLRMRVREPLVPLRAIAIACQCSLADVESAVAILGKQRYGGRVMLPDADIKPIADEVLRAKWQRESHESRQSSGA